MDRVYINEHDLQFFLFNLIYSFICEKERAVGGAKSKGRRGRVGEGEKERKRSRLAELRAESDTGLYLTTQRS